MLCGALEKEVYILLAILAQGEKADSTDGYLAVNNIQSMKPLIYTTMMVSNKLQEGRIWKYINRMQLHIALQTKRLHLLKKKKT